MPNAWHAMGVMLSAAGSLAWLRNTTAPDTPYDTLTKEAATWPPGTENLLFLPYLAGERTPHADPNACGAFAGLSIRHDRGALTRAVLEGVAFGLRDSLDLLVELGGRPERGRVAGGGARSDLWTKHHRVGARAAAASESRSTRARRSAPRSWAASPQEPGPTSTPA